MMNEALSSSETSVLTRATRRDIPEDTILHSHRRENLKSSFALLAYPYNLALVDMPCVLNAITLCAVCNLPHDCSLCTSMIKN
jgi:hypothetical protein